MKATHEELLTLAGIVGTLDGLEGVAGILIGAGRYEDALEKLKELKAVRLEIKKLMGAAEEYEEIEEDEE